MIAGRRSRMAQLSLLSMAQPRLAGGPFGWRKGLRKSAACWLSLTSCRRTESDGAPSRHVPATGCESRFAQPLGRLDWK